MRQVLGITIGIPLLILLIIVVIVEVLILTCLNMLAKEGDSWIVERKKGIGE